MVYRRLTIIIKVCLAKFGFYLLTHSLNLAELVYSFELLLCVTSNIKVKNVVVNDFMLLDIKFKRPGISS